MGSASSSSGRDRRRGARTWSAGERIQFNAEIENLLNQGRYLVHLGVNRAEGAGVALYVHSVVDFVVFGGPGGRGMVTLPQQVEAEISRGKR
jgi:hypothetical protein